jgi:hypothetical protein
MGKCVSSFDPSVIDPNKQRTPLQKAATANYVFLSTIRDMKDFRKRLGALQPATEAVWQKFLTLAYEEYGFNKTNIELEGIGTKDEKRKITTYNKVAKTYTPINKRFCRKCDDKGIVDTLIFSGAERKLFCVCVKGQELFAIERPYELIQREKNKEQEKRQEEMESRRIRLAEIKKEGLLDKYRDPISRFIIQWELNKEREIFRCKWCSGIFAANGWVKHTNECQSYPIKPIYVHPTILDRVPMKVLKLIENNSVE